MIQGDRAVPQALGIYNNKLNSIKNKRYLQKRKSDAVVYSACFSSADSSLLVIAISPLLQYCVGSRNGGEIKMKQVLEEFFYGNIRPNEQSFHRGTDFDKAMKAFSSGEEQLTAQLEGQQKELLIQMVNAYAEIVGNTSIEHFLNGFRLGARFMLEMLSDDDRIFMDI